MLISLLENTEFMAMLVSLAAVIIGPIVTFKIAKTQILAPIRQKWIDELRELMSDFLSECQSAIVINEGAGLLDVDKTDNALFLKLLYTERKLDLMLNPTEDDHIKLLNCVRDITEEVQHGVSDYVTFGERVADASDLCKRILKTEWERVKKGEPGLI